MNYLAEQREREERIKARELNRLKERKPHLFNGTPQNMYLINIAFTYSITMCQSQNRSIRQCAEG